MHPMSTEKGILLATVVILSCCLVTSPGLVPCPENLCAPIDCRSSECENGRLSKDASFCGCCPSCITFLKEGDPCEPELRVPRLTECGPKLKCSPNTQKCAPSEE